MEACKKSDYPQGISLRRLFTYVNLLFSPPTVQGLRSSSLCSGTHLCCCLQVQGELAVVDKTNAQVQSFARANFNETCEAAINEQIK